MPIPRPVFAPAENEAEVAAELRISADSHFGEPLDLWQTRLPERFRDKALTFPRLALYETNHHLRTGGWDPQERLKDLALDGTAAEVLYPTLGSNAWSRFLDDHELEQAHIRVYNDWVAEFCSVAPHRFWGQAMISIWDIDQAVGELERAKKAGLRGATIPIGPPEELPYTSPHYEKLWAAAQSLGMPLSMHINALQVPRPEWGLLPYPVTKFHAMRSMADMIGSGVLERYPELHIIFAETGSGWIPFFAQEYEYYLSDGRLGGKDLPNPPSEYIYRQVYTTFIGDQLGGYLAADYGKDNFLWSSDYPHPACTWPYSGMIIAQDLGHLASDVRANIIRNTVARLYNNGELPPPPDPAPADVQPLDNWTQSMRLPGASAGFRQGGG